MLSRKSHWLRRGALSLAGLMLSQTLLPLPLAAVGGGPTQPEFSDFQPASGGYQVNPFTGDFSWALPVIDIPGAHGGGYSLSLNYNSGVSQEQEASWVGFGWSLSPGAIQRSLRGFPDDINGDTVRYWNRVPRNWTVGLAGNFGAEAFSANLPFSGNATLRYNSNTGFAWTKGLGLTFMDGVGSLNYNLTDGEGSFDFTLNIGKAMSARMKALDGLQSTDPVVHAALMRQYERYVGKRSINLIGGGSHAFVTRGLDSRAIPSPQYVGESWTVSPSLMGAPTILQLGPDSRLSGTFSQQRNVGTGGVVGAASKLNAYGYMYTGNAGNDDMRDYYVEKQNTFEKTDRILGIPFSNPDQFVVNAEGVAGGFRMWHNRPGHFKPNEVTSTTTLNTLTVEGELGANVGGGATVGGGLQTLAVKDWDLPGNTTQYAFAQSITPEDEAVFFRFNNDLGGQVGFTPTDDLLQASLAVQSNVPGARTVAVNVPGTISQQLNSGSRSTRSSLISYHTNTEMASLDPVSGHPYKAYTRDATALSKVKRDGAANPISNGIGEFAVTEANGARYVFGLPVYARNEYTLSYDTKTATIQDNFMGYKNISNDALLETKVGEERDAPYAASYLLTEITGADYIDRTGNGATSDDLGGYTRFEYTQAIGTGGSAMKSTGNWYAWRVPFTGLRYERGSLSDPQDDRLAAQGGEREVYYLKAIETRTHIAYFVTGSTDFTLNGIHIRGSGEQRLDGIEAADNVTAANSATARGTQRLEKLERIELFAKNEAGLPSERIKTVFFEYDYSLCTGIPDHLNHVPANPSAPNTGKLTLKRVWAEYGDAREALIHPYTFDYNYSTVTYPSPYQAQFGSYGSGLTQNPPYDVKNVDAWGQYQPNGASRHNKYQTWLNQGTQPSGFDPAAWHLKTITLPTQGQVHVQYEQHTYNHVQDRKALAMVSLLSSPSADRFYLNTADMGTLTLAEKNQLVALMQEQFVHRKEKIYFKFYYTLLGPGAIPVTAGSCNGDFITGYADVQAVGQDAGGIYVQFQTGAGDIEQLPRRVCRDFVQTQRAGKSVLTGNCNAADGVDGSGGPLEVVMSFATYLTTMQTGIPGTGGSVLSCLDLSLPDSYLRVPMPRPKRAGGVRVRRVLLYDAGIETGDKVLLGKEYLYEETSNGIRHSYGVATNEPGAMREESALTVFLPRFSQALLDRVVAGRDKETTEGPLGESILPGPGIGYSKVIVKDIHAGPTSAGFVAHEFFTCKDYPFDMQLGGGSASDLTPIAEERDWMLIPGGALNVSISNLWLTQGFRFVQNQMHGKPRSTSTYGGDFTKPAEWMLSNRETYAYYDPGEPIPMMQDLYTAPVAGHPGREAELVMERMVVADVYNNLDLEVDGDLGLSPVPVPFFSIFPYLSNSTRIMSRHLTSQVISYPAIVKSVTSYVDGITTTTTNDAFSPLTGEALITSSPDEFDGMNLQQSTAHDGTLRSISVQAANYYKELGGKCFNERFTIRSSGADVLTKTVTSNHIYLGLPAPPSGALEAKLQKLTPGDLVALTSTSTGALDGIYHVENYYETGKAFELLPTRVYKYSTTPVTTSLNLEVLRSGRTNQLGLSVGSIATYGEPTMADIANHTLEGVIAASAIEISQVVPVDTSQIGSWPNALPSGIENLFEKGLRNKWRMKASYACRASIIPGNEEALTQPGYTGTQGRNYNGAGIFENFTLFRWENPVFADTSLWIKSTAITTYALHGEAIESRSAINVPSTAKLGYAATLPYLTATNSPAKGVLFESFENYYQVGATYTLEDGITLSSPSVLDATTAHAGHRSLQLTTAAANFTLREMKDIAGRKCTFRIWVREDYATNGGTGVAVGSNHPDLRITFDVPSGLSPLPLTKTAQTGQWSLYEATMPSASPVSGGAFTPTVQFNTWTPGRKIWIDDVRVQPEESEVSCAVFDPVTHRLLASLNSNHFATFYHYNGEGKLQRQSIETEDGTKTIQESYFNLPTATR